MGLGYLVALLGVVVVWHVSGVCFWVDATGYCVLPRRDLGDFAGIFCFSGLV